MNLKMLAGTLLFKRMSDDEIASAMKELHAKQKKFSKDALILHAGDTTSFMGLIMDGSATIESNDIWGNRTILSHVAKGQFFAESYALLKDEPLLVDVRANEPSHILFLNIRIAQDLDPTVHTWTVKLLSNLLIISSRKNLMLSARSFHIAPKSIRSRVMAYLNAVALHKHSDDFTIPFDRQQLADYLNLDRSALSKELGSMQRDGLITTRRSHFILHQNNSGLTGN